MAIRFSTFIEGEDYTSFCPASSMTEAINKVRNDSNVAGLTVDLVNDSGDVDVSYEVRPFMPILSWREEECYDF